MIAAVVAWITSVSIGLAFAAPLTGDEAAYALLARGDGADWLYRSRGVVVLARLGLALGGGDLGLHVVSMVASLPLVLAVAAVGRRAFGPWIGAAAAAVIAGAHPFVVGRGFELLGDLPATACLLGAIAIILAELGGDTAPTYRLVATAPLFGAALYLRYASAPVIALVGAAALVTWWRPIRARPGPAVAAAAVLVMLVAPFAIASLHATGSPIGILALASKVSGRTYLGRGLLIYFGANPFRLYGAIAPVVLLAGLASLARPSPRRRAAYFLGAIALGQITALGIVSHASSRFIFVAIVLLVVLGVDALARAIPSPRMCTPRRTRRSVVAAWAGMAIAMVPVQHRFARGLAELTGAAAAIRADASGRPCTVVARALPQLMWYSGCAGWKLVDPSQPPPVDDRVHWYAASAPRRPIDPSTLGVVATPLAPGTWRLGAGR